MIIRPTSIGGAFVIDVDRSVDERGSFGRLFCEREFAAAGLDGHVSQASMSSNNRRGTLRGMHFADAEAGEVKVVRCARGAIYDVLLDLRSGSPTFRTWVAETLTAENGRALYVPSGVAHGFITLEDSTDVLYQMNVPYRSGLARGVRWDDPAFDISWAERPLIMSDRDRNYERYRLQESGISGAER